MPNVIINFKPLDMKTVMVLTNGNPGEECCDQRIHNRDAVFLFFPAYVANDGFRCRRMS